jgi:hypothetical protein
MSEEAKQMEFKKTPVHWEKFTLEQIEQVRNFVNNHLLNSYMDFSKEQVERMTKMLGEIQKIEKIFIDNKGKMSTKHETDPL